MSREESKQMDATRNEAVATTGNPERTTNRIERMDTKKIQPGMQRPVALPEVAPLSLQELKALYTVKPAVEGALKPMRSVPAHRFGYPQAHLAMNAGAADNSSIDGHIAGFTRAGLSWPTVASRVLQTKLDTTYEQLECVSLECGRGVDKLVALLRIKRAKGFNGGTGTAGSIEHVAFWADWDNTGTYTYLGTAQARVRDGLAMPVCGVVYSVAFPVSLGARRAGLARQKTCRVRAVLSWAVPPSTKDPEALSTWGNSVEAKVQMMPKLPGEMVYAKIRPIERPLATGAASRVPFRREAEPVSGRGRVWGMAGS